MKKSFAILAIAECLVEPHFPEDPMKEAEYILKKLQRLGMSPPYTLKNIQTPGVLDGKKGVMYNNQMVQEWDDEEPQYGGGEP